MRSKSSATKEADRLFSLHVRASGPCVAAAYPMRLVSAPVEGDYCGGPLQCCHIVTRARRSIRWDEANAVPMCAGHHVWFTHNPDAWRAFVADDLGIDYDALRQRSFTDPPMDPYDVIQRFKEVRL